MEYRSPAADKEKKKTQQYKGEPLSTILQVTRCERRNNAHWRVFLWEELGHTHARHACPLLGMRSITASKTSHTFKSSPITWTSVLQPLWRVFPLEDRRTAQKTTAALTGKVLLVVPAGLQS